MSLKMNSLFLNISLNFNLFLLIFYTLRTAQTKGHLSLAVSEEISRVTCK